MFTLKQLESKDAKLYAEHISRHVSESGTRNNPIFVPMYHAPKQEDIIRDKERRWEIEVGTPLWERSFGILIDNKIVAHIDLKGSYVETELHRVELNIGIEEDFRGQGFAHKLMQKSINWAKETGFIDYIDLNVFSHNKIALKLYQTYQFIEIGRQEDRFRIYDKVIDDIHMCLKIIR